jgi:hypothetical protein
MSWEPAANLEFHASKRDFPSQALRLIQKDPGSYIQKRLIPGKSALLLLNELMQTANAFQADPSLRMGYIRMRLFYHRCRI